MMILGKYITNNWKKNIEIISFLEFPITIEIAYNFQLSDMSSSVAKNIMLVFPITGDNEFCIQIIIETSGQ